MGKIIRILKNNWKTILVAVLLVGIFLFVYSKVTSKLNQEIEDLKGNYEAYVNLYNGELAANNLLKLSEHELKNAKDSLLRELGYFIEENRRLKKLKTPIIVGGVTQTIVDSIIIEVPAELPPFDVTKTLNPETIIRVQGEDSILNIIPNISNTLMIEIGVNRVYKNSYPTKWSRFWNFDWKKVNSYEYQLEQSNDLVKLNDVKIINIKD